MTLLKLPAAQWRMLIAALFCLRPACAALGPEYIQPTIVNSQTANGLPISGGSFCNLKANVTISGTVT
jgi:hypothetical protein